MKNVDVHRNSGFEGDFLGCNVSYYIHSGTQFRFTKKVPHIVSYVHCNSKGQVLGTVKHRLSDHLWVVTHGKVFG